MTNDVRQAEMIVELLRVSVLVQEHVAKRRAASSRPDRRALAFCPRAFRADAAVPLPHGWDSTEPHDF